MSKPKLGATLPRAPCTLMHLSSVLATRNTINQKDRPWIQCWSERSGDTVSNFCAQGAVYDTTNLQPRFDPLHQRHSERSKRAACELAAVNGVVIPSKIPPGGTPNHGPWVFKEVNHHPCSICGMTFGRKAWVKTHMPSCVEQIREQHHYHIQSLHRHQ